MIGLKMLKIAHFGLQFIEIFQRRGLRPSTPAVIVAIQCKIVLLKNLTVLTPLDN